MDILSNKLDCIKKQPGLYIGKKSLILLKAYIDGYIERQNELSNNYDLGFYPGFQEYIQTRFNIKSSHNWADIINFFSTTEEEAFDRFYVLLEGFLKNEI